MHSAALVRPFAQAAFRTARGAGALPEWSAALAALRDALAAPELAALVADPRVDRDVLAERIGAALAGAVPDGVARLAALLAGRGLLPAFAALAEQFEASRRTHEGRVKVTLATAQALDGQQLDLLRSAAARTLAAEVDLDTRVDPELIGGAVLRIGDRVIDGSVRGRIEQLAAALKA